MVMVVAKSPLKFYNESVRIAAMVQRKLHNIRKLGVYSPGQTAYLNRIEAAIPRAGLYPPSMWKNTLKHLNTIERNAIKLKTDLSKNKVKGVTMSKPSMPKLKMLGDPHLNATASDLLTGPKYFFSKKKGGTQ